MIISDNKKLMSMVTAKRSKDGTRTEAEMPVEQSADAPEAHGAAEDLIAAVHSKSAHAVMDAIKALIAHCK